MRKKWCALLAVCLFLWGNLPTCNAQPLTVSAESALVMEASTGRILFEKNANARMSMASTTKIMTALLAVESERLEEEITVTTEMLRTEGSSIYLKEGERWTLRALVTGLMLESGNDAALAIAIAMDGSEQAFAARMNRRAGQLGLHDTHFVTASGLDDEMHYTTARDMAVLGCAAMANPEFAQIVSRSSATVEIGGETPRKRTFYNHNRLLKEMDGCIGVKTGFTKKSGRCLVSCCERDGIRLIAVTLRAPDDWNDHRQLMNVGFASVERMELNAGELELAVPVVGAGEIQRTRLTEAGPVSAVIPTGRSHDIRMKIECEPFLYAPVISDRVAGRISYWLDGEQIAEVPLLTAETIAYQPRERSGWERFWTGLLRFFGFLNE